MLYENYRKKILRLSEFLAKVVKHLALILTITGIIVTIGTTLLVTIGLPSRVDCTAEVFYGDAYECQAKAFLSDVRLEYASQDADDWNENQPYLPGTYRVRAVGVSAFDKDRYGKESTFKILPCPLQVGIQETSLLYGNTPTFTSETTKYGDEILCEGFVYGNIAAPSTTITPDLDKIKVLDQRGNDVTYAYDIQAKPVTVTFEKRPLQLLVESASKVYDSNALTYDQYQIIGGTLGFEDTLTAVFTGTQTDAGSSENTSAFTIHHTENGVAIDVTSQYALEITPGTLTVDKRTLAISTGSLETGYTGQNVSCQEYTLDNPSALLPGHTLQPTFGAPAIDCGSYTNQATFRIVDAQGRDVTANYNIVLRPGTITIKPALLTVYTESASWVYDGLIHDHPIFTAEGLLPGHKVSEQFAPGAVAYLQNVGQTENRINLTIVDENGNDVTNNYAFDNHFGTLEVTKRPLTITTSSNSWVYDGTVHVEQSIDADNLVATHELGSRNWSWITDVGQTPNTCGVSIYYYSSKLSVPEDMTDNYDITYVWGTLEVTPRPITFITSGASWVYDGQVHNFPGCNMPNLAAGHEIVTSDWPTITDVGQISNTCSVTIYDSPRVNAVGDDPTDVTKNYDITFIWGTLKVTPRPLTFTTFSDEWVYDGEVHSRMEFAVDNVADGQVIDISNWATITNAGKIDNTCSVIIYDGPQVDAEGYEPADVTKNYDITFVWGTLEVLQRPITFTTFDQEWTYDDQPHSYEVYQAENLVEGHVPIMTNWTTLIDVAKEENQCDVRILTLEGIDVTANYAFTYQWGTVEVLPRPIVIVVEDVEKVYDGTPLLAGPAYVRYYPNLLVEGHTLHATVSGSRTEVGWEAATITDVKILSSTRDVTSNYEITSWIGSIWIWQARLVVTAASDSKFYDGTPLTNPEYTIKVLEGNFAPDDTLHASVSGSITSPGTEKNEVTVQILHRYGYDTSWQYKIFTVDGTLTVLDPTASPSESDLIIGRIKTDTSGTIYLRQCSYGDYTGQGWGQGIEYEKQLLGYFSYNYLASMAVHNSGGQLHTAEIQELLNGMYMLPYYMSNQPNQYGGFQYDIPRSDVDYTDGGWPDYPNYQIPYYTLPSDSDSYEYLKGNLGEYAIYEEAYRKFVYAWYLTVDDTSRAYMQGIIDKEGFDLSDPTVISKIATYIQNAATYNLEYDLNMEAAENVVIAFLDQYKEGVCRHYAGAATLLYRTLGIPARYTVGWMIETEAGTFVDIAYPGHAWVEVYIDGVGWIQVEVTGGYGNGGGAGNGSSGEGGDHGGSGSSGGECDGSCGGECDGSEDSASLGGSGMEDLDTIFGQIKNDYSGILYLRQRSYGNFNGQTWNVIAPYAETLPGGLSYNYLASLAVLNSGGYIHVAEFKNMLLGFYMLPYYMSQDGEYPFPGTDTNYTTILQAAYSLSYYSLPSVSNGFEYLKGNLGEYAKYEEEYRKYVYETYLAVDDATRDYMQNIIEAEGFSLSDPRVILKIARYIQTAATYNLEYDPAMDMESNIVIAFLDQYKEGKCTHYASAATLLYRTLGIPARYTVGWMLETEKDTFVDIKNPGHAWVEVYIDGVGWIQVEVTGSDNSGGSGSGSGGHKPSMTIAPTYQYKFYDGKPLHADGIDMDSTLQELIKAGYTYSCGIVGRQLEPGQSASTIVDFTLYDPQGNDVTGNYNIQFEDGILEVFPANTQIIRLYLYQLQKYYDGTPLMLESSDFEVIDMPEGITLTISLNISLTEPGALTLSQINADRDRYVTYTVEQDGVDVTSKYQLIFDVFEGMDPFYAPLRVDPRPIEVTSMSQSRQDNGETLTNGKCFISYGSLVDGHKLVATAHGEISTVGSTPNTLQMHDIQILDQNGNDVTSYYDIRIIQGTLTITPVPI